jgi:amino acid transporter
MSTRLVNLTEASWIIDYICMCIIYLCFYRALKAQSFNRKDLPYIGWARPYCAYFGLAIMIFTVTCYGYATFLPGCKSSSPCDSRIARCLVNGLPTPSRSGNVQSLIAYEANVAELHISFREEIR